MPEWSPLRGYSKSRAVLIGTSNYSELPKLPAALNSLKRMAGLLTSPLCGWPADQVVVLENEPHPGNLPDRLITLFEDASDIAFFYYVGHGQVDLEGQLCLGLAGSRKAMNRRAATSLQFEAVRRAMLDSPAETKIVILDCCYAGVANRPVNSLAGSDDLLDKTTGSGAYTMAAAAASFPARYDITPGAVEPQTYFTQYFVDVVERGIPRQPSVLRLHPLFIELRDRLATDKLPVPVARSVDAARDFIFAHNAAPQDVQRDTEREVYELNQRLEEAAEHVRALEAELAELREQARSQSAMPAEERKELTEAIDETQRRLDEIAAAHEVAVAEAMTSTQGTRELVNAGVTSDTPTAASDAVTAVPGGGASASLAGGGAHLRERRRRVSAAGAVVVSVLATIIAISSDDTPGKFASSPAASHVRITAQPSATRATASNSASATVTGSPTKTPTTRRPTTRVHPPSPTADSAPTPSTGVAPSHSTPPPVTTSPPPTTPTPKKTTTTKPPPGPQQITGYSNASPHSCSTVGSSTSGTQVRYHVVNNSAAAIYVLYLTSNGSSGQTRTVPAGQPYSDDVRIGQAWMIQNSFGGCLNTFTITGSGTITVA